MAKRMTDTEKWQDDWFVALPPKYKLFWVYLCDRCDHAGIWKISGSVASALIGETVDLDEALSVFSGRIEVHEGFWWIKKFCAFQYGPELDPRNKVHKSALKILAASGLQAPTKPLPSPLEGDKVKDKDKATLLTVNLDFEQFWKAYPNKVGKAKALDAWRKYNPPLEAVLKTLAVFVTTPQWTKDNGEYIPHPTTWLNRQGWTDEVVSAQKRKRPDAL